MMHAKAPNFGAIVQCVGLKQCDPVVVSIVDALSLLDSPVKNFDKDDNSEYIEYKKHGICLLFNNGVLTSVFFMSTNKDQTYASYSGKFPYGLEWRKDISDVIASVNLEPRGQGGGRKGHFGYINPWGRYDLGSYSLHFEFTADGENIQMVTVSSLACSSPNS